MSLSGPLDGQFKVVGGPRWGQPAQQLVQSSMAPKYTRRFSTSSTSGDVQAAKCKLPATVEMKEYPQVAMAGANNDHLSRK